MQKKTEIKSQIMKNILIYLATCTKFWCLSSKLSWGAKVNVGSPNLKIKDIQNIQNNQNGENIAN